MTRSLSIAQINTADRGGGAAAVSAALMGRFTERGHRVRQFVGRTHSTDSRFVALADDVWSRLANRYPGRGLGRIGRGLRVATRPAARSAWASGREDFDFPATWKLLDQPHSRPDVVHAHNLHGGYFDLRALAPLSLQIPTVITLHDMWLLTGHCAHARACERWRTGCGSCPDLAAYPAIRRDATAENWRAKRDIYASSRLCVAAPSRWLRDRIAQSMLMPAIADLRVIPNGVDIGVFRPDRDAARRALGIARDARVVMLTAGLGRSMWKDAATIDAVTARLTQRGGPRVVFVAPERAPAISLAYQASDIYLHASHADTFPLAVLEAMASGAVVVATDVGGISEQVTNMQTGMLVPAGASQQMAAAVEALFADEPRRRALADAALTAVRSRFSIDRQVDAYLEWYGEILQ